MVFILNKKMFRVMDVLRFWLFGLKNSYNPLRVLVPALRQHYNTACAVAHIVPFCYQQNTISAQL